MNRTSAQRAEVLFVRLLGKWRGHPIGRIQPRQRGDAIDTAILAVDKSLPPDVLQIAELNVTPRLDVFGDMIQILLSAESALFGSAWRHDPDCTVVEVDAVPLIDQSHVMRAMGISIRQNCLHILRVLQYDIVKDLQAELAESYRVFGAGDESFLIVCRDSLCDPPGRPKTGWITLPPTSAINPRNSFRNAMTSRPTSTPTFPRTPRMFRSAFGAVGPTTKSGPPRKKKCRA